MHNLDKKLIAERVAFAFACKGIDPHIAAKKTDVSKYTVNQWLKGSSLTCSALQLISCKLDISINWILLGIGDISPTSNLHTSYKERQLLQIMRHLGPDLTSSVHTMLDSMLDYQSKPTSVDSCAGIEDLLDDASAAALTVLMDGTIVKCSSFFADALGYKHVSEVEGQSVFSLLATDCHQQCNQEMEDILSLGYGQCQLYEFIKADKKQRLNTIMKSSLEHFDQQLAFKVLIKAIS